MNRRDYCESCPIKKTDDLFKTKTLETWEKVLGVEAQSLKFDDVLSRLYDAMRFSEHTPEKLSFKTARLVAIYSNERNFHEDVKK